MAQDQENIIGENIRQFRIAKAETQARTASNLHISRSCLANYENGMRTPQHEILQKISEYFKVSENVLRRKNF